MSKALEALYDGDVEGARELLPGDDALTVFEAAAFGRVERLRALLDENPSRATAFAEDGFTALHVAVFAEEEEAARLIQRGANVDAISTGEIARVAPLGTAAFVGSAAMARLLLDAGADPNARGAGGFTALHTVAANGNEALAKLLVERSADATLANDAGQQPVDLAASEALRRLLE